MRGSARAESGRTGPSSTYEGQRSLANSPSTGRVCRGYCGRTRNPWGAFFRLLLALWMDRVRRATARKRRKRRKYSSLRKSRDNLSRLSRFVASCWAERPGRGSNTPEVPALSPPGVLRWRGQDALATAGGTPALQGSSGDFILAPGLPVLLHRADHVACGGVQPSGL